MTSARQALPALSRRTFKSLPLLISPPTAPATSSGNSTAKPLSLSHARQSHAHVLRSNLTSPHSLTQLISAYASLSRFSDATTLLLNWTQQPPTIFSFSALIHASSKHGRFALVLELFSQLLSHGLLPDAHVLPSVVKSCAALNDLSNGKIIHAIACLTGSSHDAYVQSSLLHMYIKCNQIKDAHCLFDQMSDRDVVIWSALVGGYARRGYVSEAKRIFNDMVKTGVDVNVVSWNGMIAGFNSSGAYDESMRAFCKMHLEGFKPDGTSISSVLPAIGDVEGLGFGVQVHCYVIKGGFGSDKCVLSSLIDMYGKCACPSEMLRVFDEMEGIDVGVCNALLTGLSRNRRVEDALRLFRDVQHKGMELNVVSWTSMIACCSQNGKDMEALDLFREMQVNGVKPNSVTIPCLLPACGNIAALMHGKAAHCFSLKRGIAGDIYVGSALIDMYSKCGKIQASRLCFQRMPTRNLVCWNATLSGYAMHGKGKEALEFYDLMQRSGQKPDFITFTCLLSACSQNGLTKEGWFYFNSMSRDHGIEARLEHYACMVSLLGRTGEVEEAYSLIKRMPYEPDPCIWGALLNSCKVHSNVKLGEIAARELFELEPENPGNYVLLSNIYASKRMWNEVDMVRDKMKNMGLRKNPGCSWVEIKNKVHMLLAGDRSHPHMDGIMQKLSELSMEMKKSGYLPVVDYVLQDVEEQDKEQILCGHSEKLAVVYGILNTPQGTPLRVLEKQLARSFKQISVTCLLGISLEASYTWNLEGYSTSKSTIKFGHLGTVIVELQDHGYIPQTLTNKFAELVALTEEYTFVLQDIINSVVEADSLLMLFVKRPCCHHCPVQSMQKLCTKIQIENSYS